MYVHERPRSVLGFAAPFASATSPGLQTGISKCPCGCGQPRGLCRSSPWGTSICLHGKYYHDCGTCNGKGKVVNRGKTCWDHDMRQCTSCAKATRLDGKQRFFGVRERARIAAGKLVLPAYA